MKYNNEHFPYDFDDERLQQETQGLMRLGVGDQIHNIAFAIRGQSGVSEIHKRQNDRTNRNTKYIAISAIFLSVISVIAQFYISRQTITVQSDDLKAIKNHLDGNTVFQKTDSILFYLKATLRNQAQNSCSKGIETFTELDENKPLVNSLKK